MQKAIFTLFSLTTFLFLANTTVFAADYTLTDVAERNTEANCWMIFSENVYDITTYVAEHDRYMDIRDWCGRDMTEDFQTKAGLGKDHKPATYEMLKDYLIGKVVVNEPTLISIENDTVETDTIDTEAPTQAVVVTRNNPYNFIIPFAITLILYLITYLMATKGWFNRVLVLAKVNLFWNSMLVVFLIPSVIFGFILVLQYPFPALAAIKFDFLYWHVEGSIAFGTLVICHFLQRFKQYLVPLRLFKKAPPVSQINNE